MVRVRDAQAGDLDAATAALRGEGTARAVPGARLGGRQVDGGSDGEVVAGGVGCGVGAGGCAVGGRELLGGRQVHGCGDDEVVAGVGVRCRAVGGRDEGAVGDEGFRRVQCAVLGERGCCFLCGGCAGLVEGAERLLKRRGGHLGERVRHRLGGRLRGSHVHGGLLASLLGGGRHVGQLLAIRTVQVFTRVIRHAPIVSGSCHLCRHGTRESVG